MLSPGPSSNAYSGGQSTYRYNPMIYKLGGVGRWAESKHKMEKWDHTRKRTFFSQWIQSLLTLSAAHLFLKSPQGRILKKRNTPLLLVHLDVVLNYMFHWEEKLWNREVLPEPVQWGYRFFVFCCTVFLRCTLMNTTQSRTFSGSHCEETEDYYCRFSRFTGSSLLKYLLFVWHCLKRWTPKRVHCLLLLW